MMAEAHFDAERCTNGSMPTVRSLLADPSISLPLKDVLSRWRERDPVDAARDASLLSSVFEARADQLLAQAAIEWGVRG